jgi:type IV pilus assembly protein PilN
MIRINLLGETEDKTGLYVLQTLLYCVVMCITAGACVVVQQGAEDQRIALENEKAVLQSQLSRLVRKTKEVEDLQKKEKLLREKLSTIALLKARKHGPVHVLNDLADAIPEEAWVGQIEESEGYLEIYGAALDEHIVAKFMQNLEKSKYFESVRLIESELYLHTEVVGTRSRNVETRVSRNDRVYKIGGESRAIVRKDQAIKKEAKLKRFSLAIKLTDPLLLQAGVKAKSDEDTKA